MKLIVAVVLALVAASYAVGPEPPKIVRSEFIQQPEGSYSYGFESDDGTVREETGELKSVVGEDKIPQNVIVVRGFYKYINSDGTVETINYRAGEDGYYPEGPSIPKVPGV